MRRQLKAGRYETPDEMARAADDLWEDAASIHAATQSGGSRRHQALWRQQGLMPVLAIPHTA